MSRFFRDPWTTYDELEFLKDLGSHRAGRSQKKAVFRPTITKQVSLYRQYLQAMPQRADWGCLDPVAITVYLHRRLAVLENQLTRPATPGRKKGTSHVRAS